MPATLPPPRPCVGWTRTADAQWQRVLIERGTGARLTAAALAAFPGATVHRVVTDVLGTAEAHRVATPLELLFDLSFVVAVAQAAASLHHAVSENHAGAGLLAFCISAKTAAVLQGLSFSEIKVAAAPNQAALLACL